MVLGILSLTGVAQAEPRIKTIWKYYSIYGNTARELKSQMRRKGPKGFWAYTVWWVNWSGTCRTNLKITYTFPKWVNKNRAPSSLRNSWDRMIRQLKLHEQGHSQHGINASREIEKSGCSKDPKRITRKWARQDKIYDKRTRHGISQGIRLP